MTWRDHLIPKEARELERGLKAKLKYQQLRHRIQRRCEARARYEREKNARKGIQNGITE